MNENLYSHFLFSSKPDNTLCTLPDGKTICYKEIDSSVAQYCHLFEKLGIHKNDRIIQQTEKCVDALCVYLATLRYGAVYIPLNTALTLEEISYFITNSKPSLFICDPQKKSDIENLITTLSISTQTESLSVKGDGTLQEKSKSLEKTYEIALKNKDEIACILYTSGTTGQQKGAVLTHGNLSTNGESLKKFWGFTENDVLLHTLPIFHCHGLFFAFHPLLMIGASIILLPKFDVDSTIQYLPQSTVFMGVPTYYTRLLSEPRFSKDITENLRLFISGSAPLLKKTFTDFENRTGKTILERYGMTETGINTSNPLIGNRMLGSVGLPLSPQNFRIVDENNHETEKNVPGHIQVKGDNVFSGYWEDAQKTKSSFTNDGFFKTGDLGFIDEKGYVTIVGREKDLIITGGLNVYPKEIEDILNQIPGVIESAVIGLPHPDLGEAVIAVIATSDKLTDTTIEDEYIGLLKTKLVNYKIPKRILFLPELPKNTMGKIQKNFIRERFSKNSFFDF
jgi:malonyl-CoA/methylmalonyl-CoA synthetase